LPVFADVLKGGKIAGWREFAPKGKGHLLMRPLGQLVLARAVGYVHNDSDGPKMPLDKIFKKLRRFDSQGGFERVDKATSVWYGVTYNPHHGTMSMRGQGAATKLLEYLLGGINNKDDLQTLRDSFRKLRRRRKIQLPPIIRLRRHK
jgi:hypothetical protein